MKGRFTMSKYAMRRSVSGRRYLTDEDFEEIDVWHVMENTEVISSNPITRKWQKDIASSSTFHSSGPRLVPTSNIITKEANHGHHHVKIKRESSPMDIPERRMIRSSKKINIVGVGIEGHKSSWIRGHDMGDNEVDDHDDSIDNDEEEEGIIPPHEYISRRQVCSFSVCEGTGRTLKGRDLCRARNAILKSTGFLES